MAVVGANQEDMFDNGMKASQSGTQLLGIPVVSSYGHILDSISED